MVRRHLRGRRSRRFTSIGCTAALVMGLATAVTVVPAAQAAPAVAFDCTVPYALNGQTTFAVDTADGDLSAFGSFAEKDLNGLGLSKDGTHAFAASDSGTIYEYSPATGRTTSHPGEPASANYLTHGAVNPATGIYYYGGFSTSGDGTIYIYGFDPSTNTSLGLVATGSVPTLGLNGDWAFDARGRLYVVGGSKSSNLFVINEQLPTTATTIAVTGMTITTIDNGAAVNGIAFGADGFLYMSTDSALYTVNPSTGAVADQTSLSQRGMTDLASCTSPSTITVRKDFPAGRVDDGDQVTLSVSGSGITQGNTATTSGDDPGLQTGPGEQAGPVIGLPGNAYTVSESGPGAAPSSSSSFGYARSWTCVNTATDDTLASGSGATGSFTMPNTAGAAVVCTFTDVARTTGIDLVKHATAATGNTAGSTITYTFTVTNTGTVPLQTITVDDPEVGPVTCPPGPLAVDASATCTADKEYLLTQDDVDAGEVDNTATATGIAPDLPDATDQDSTSTPIEAAPALRLVKHAGAPIDVNGDGLTDAGDTIDYTFTVTNTGNLTITGIAVDDAKAGAVACAAGSLNPGESMACTAPTYTITTADEGHGSVDNTATASGTTPDGPVDSPPSSTTTPVMAQQTGLTLAKTATPATITATGQHVGYRFTVTNTGNVTETGLAIDDTLTAPAGPAPTITCPSTSLAPGASTTCTADYVATQADVDAGSIVNTATATAAAPDGATVTSNQSSATVTAAASPRLALVKSADPTTVTAAGQSVSYRFAVTNTGNVTMTGLTITDTFDAPAGPVPAITCAATALAPGASTTCTASYRATQADIDNGVIVNTATASAATPVGTTTTSSPSSAAVNATQAGSLTLVKAASPTTIAAAGQTVAYTFTVTNNGNVTVGNLNVADSFTAPAGPDPAVNCPTTTLRPGQSVRCSVAYTVTQADVDHGSIANQALASGTTPGGGIVTSMPSNARVNVAQAPALSTVKTASPATISQAGQRVSYRIVVTNSGNVTVSGIDVADAMAAPAAPSPTPVCPATTLRPGASMTCTANYVSTQDDIDAGSVTNTATASGATPGGDPVDSPPSSATVGVTQTPALTLVKAATPTTITAAGDSVHYTFEVTNSGNVTVTGLSIADTPTAPAGPAPAITCPVTSLAPAASTTCTADYAATQADIDAGKIVNTAVASASSPNGPVASPPSQATVTAPAAPALTVLKTAQPTTITAPGQTVSYDFLVTNTGNVTISSLTVNDVMDAPAGPDPAVTCPVTTLAPGVSTHCTTSYVSTQADVDAGSISNAATATGTPPGGGRVTSPPSPVTVPLVENPSLSLVKTADPDTVVAAGQTITYRFAVTNDGNQTIADLAVADVFASPGDIPAPTVTCAATTLAPGATTVCTATHTVTQADLDNGEIANTATATGTDPRGNVVTSPPDQTTVGVTERAHLSLIKSADPAVVSATGTAVTYTFVVTNNGNLTVHGLSIADAFVDPAGPGSAVTCPATTLAPGESTTCTSSYTADQDDIDHGSIDNTATATALDPHGNEVPPATSSTSVGVRQHPKLTLVKSADPVTVTHAGQSVTYSFVVTNGGNVTVDDIAVDDAFAPPAGTNDPVACPQTSLGAGTSMTCTLTYVVTQADMDNGVITNAARASGEGPPGNHVESNQSSAAVTANPAPALSVVKTPSPATITAAGQTVHYTFDVTNTGNATLHDIAISDAFDAPAGPGAVPSCPPVLLAPGGTTTCEADYTATQADVDHGSIVNTAVATAVDPHGNPAASEPDAATVDVARAPALTVAKRATPAAAHAAGDTIRYAFTVTNTGNVTLSGVHVSDTFTAPAGPALTPSCPGAVLTPDAVMTCTASYTLSQADVDAGGVVNSAVATGTPPGGPPIDSPPSGARVDIPAAPSLRVVKDASPATVSAAGQDIAYTVTVTNTGDVTITDLGVDDVITSPSGEAAPQFTCPQTTLAPRAGVTCTGAAAASQADIDNGHVADTATATGTAPDGTPVPPASDDADVIAQQNPALVLVKTADPVIVTAAGQHVDYRFQVTNTGNVTVTGLVIDDAPSAPAGPALEATCPVTTLAPGAGTTCAASYTVTQDDVDNGSITNAATAAGTTPDGSGVESPVSTAAVTALPGPAMHLVKNAAVTDVDGNGHTGLGDTIGWTFTVTNTGNVTIDGLSVDDAKAGTVECPRATLAPGATITCSAAPYTITQSDVDHGSVDNTAVAVGIGPHGDPVASDPSSTHTPITVTGALAMVKRGTLTDGTITWTFTVTNTGALTVHAVHVDDARSGAVTCAATTLAPGESLTCRAVNPYRPSAADIAAGQARNSATASGLDPLGATVTSAVASATVALFADPPLAQTGDPALPATLGWGTALLLAGLLLLLAGAVRTRRRRV